MTFIQCWTSVEDVGPTLYKCYANVFSVDFFFSFSVDSTEKNVRLKTHAICFFYLRYKINIKLTIYRHNLQLLSIIPKDVDVDGCMIIVLHLFFLKVLVP